MRRSWLRAVLLTAAAAALAAALWAGWQAWQVSRDLSAVSSAAFDLERALTSGDAEGTNAALARLQDHSIAASERTDGATWSVLTKAPWVGDDARGIRLVSDLMADLAEQGLEPLAASAADLDSLLPRRGEIPVQQLTALREPVADASVAFAAADEALQSEDPTLFVEPLKRKYRELAERVASADHALRTADTALSVMPGMLGADGPRSYLLVVQNNAEIRATGGLPGAVSLLRADDGAVSMVRQVAASEFGEADLPALPLTLAERKLYGPQLGTYFVDANFTPDFPRVAELMKARWEETSGEQIDGVLAVDPVALSYLLEATGPVTVPDVTLTSENAVLELVHRVYLRYPSPDDQDAWFREVAREVFDTVLSGTKRPQLLMEALDRAAAEGRLSVHSFEPSEQSALAGTRVAGELVTDPEAPPQVGVSVNDTTGGKMSFYLRHSVRVGTTYCQDGSQGLAGDARFESFAPADVSGLPDYVTGGGVYGIERGSQLVTVRLHAPVGGTVSDVEVNSKPVDAQVVDQDGRPVATVYVQVDPGRVVDLAWAMTTGAGQTGDVAVTVTPGIEPGTQSSTVRSACG